MYIKYVFGFYQSSIYLQVVMFVFLTFAILLRFHGSIIGSLQGIEGG